MPFSKENRRFTLSLIAIVVIAVCGLISFSWLSHTDWERTYLYGTVVGGLVGVMSLQVFNLSKTNRVSEAVQQGQENAERRTELVKAEVRSIAAQCEGLPKTMAELTEHIDQRIAANSRQIVAQTVAEMRAHGWQMPEVVQRTQA